jgi:hypothetical protein
MLNPIAVVTVEGYVIPILDDLDQDHIDGLEVKRVHISRNLDSLGPDGLQHPSA